jgi:hypothetical protein
MRLLMASADRNRRPRKGYALGIQFPSLNFSNKMRYPAKLKQNVIFLSTLPSASSSRNSSSSPSTSFAGT